MTVKKLSSVEVANLNFKRNRKKKKTPSLFDTELSSRTYWGREDKNNPDSKVDNGTLLIMSLMGSKINKSLRNNIVIDIDNHDMSKRLVKEFRDQLKIHQINLLQEKMEGVCFRLDRFDNGDYLIIILDGE